MGILIINIKILGQVEQGNRKAKVAGKEMAALPCLENAWLQIDDDKITGFGSMNNWKGTPEGSKYSLIDASGKIVLPSWCDSHTHLVFAGSREKEFVDRINGLSYEEIAKRGGGILNSAKKLHDTDEEILAENALKRLHEISLTGTGAVEIKSGYGLSVQDEIKMLRAIKKIKTLSSLTIRATFLGAHAVPSEYKDNRKEYIRLITDEMLPKIAEENLAEFCDVFCDRGFFTPEETDTILAAGWKHGLQPKIHANELGLTGGIQAGVRNNALSVDHLEHTGEEEIALLLGSNTMPTLLPSTAFFLGLHYPPARKMIDAGLPVALASDYNPGSSPSGSIPFILSLACIKLKMTPEEAINAVTINGAYAMGIGEAHGSIAIGKKANLFITKEIPGYSYIPYAFSNNPVETVILNGRIMN